MSEKPDRPFRELQREKPIGALREFYLLVRHNKKYWMLPLLVMFVLLGVLVISAGSSAAPFIYRLF